LLHLSPRAHTGGRVPAAVRISTGWGGLYDFTHSAVVLAISFGAVWLLLRKPLLEMFGWALHILIDVFTHRRLFAIKFLWPVSSVYVNGIRWETPWFLVVNYTALAAVYLFPWIYRVRGSSSAGPGVKHLGKTPSA
jgi:membrane-bound metal-dependent hydrolase YbcI (DUF457 family)